MSRQETAAWATTALLFLAVLGLAGTGIWTGDNRYGWTAAVMVAPLAVALISAMALAGLRQKARERGGNR